MTGVAIERRRDGSFSMDAVLRAYDQACGVTPAPQQAVTKPARRRRIMRLVDDKKSLRAWPTAAVEAEFDAWNTLNQEFAEYLVDYNEWQHPQSGGYLGGEELEALVKPIRDDHKQFRRLPFEIAQRTAWIVHRRFLNFTKSQGDESMLAWCKPYSFYLRPPGIITNAYDAERDPTEIRFRLKAGIDLGCTAHPALIDVLLYAARIKGVQLRRNQQREWYLVPSFQRGGEPKLLADVDDKPYDNRGLLEAVADIFLQRRVVGMTASELLPVVKQRGLELTGKALGQQMSRYDIRSKVKLIDGARGHYYLAKRVFDVAVDHEILADMYD